MGNEEEADFCWGCGEKLVFISQKDILHFGPGPEKEEQYQKVNIPVMRCLGSIMETAVQIAQCECSPRLTLEETTEFLRSVWLQLENNKGNHE